MSFADDIVVDNPLGFFDFLEEEFSENVLWFGSNSCFWFHQVLWAKSHWVSLSLRLVDFGLSEFGCLICVGVIIVLIQLLGG